MQFGAIPVKFDGHGVGGVGVGTQFGAVPVKFDGHGVGGVGVGTQFGATPVKFDGHGVGGRVGIGVATGAAATMMPMAPIVGATAPGGAVGGAEGIDTGSGPTAASSKNSVVN
jgi:hypothetical protein